MCFVNVLRSMHLIDAYYREILDASLRDITLGRCDLFGKNSNLRKSFAGSILCNLRKRDAKFYSGALKIASEIDISKYNDSKNYLISINISRKIILYCYVCSYALRNLTSFQNFYYL